MLITRTLIKFPEISLLTSDAHKLRGYFGEIFKEHSPLLHNHFEDGKFRYAYPLVQYKVVDSVPMLVGFNEGGKLLVQLFLKIREIELEGKKYPVLSKNMQQQNINITEKDVPANYQFKTLWLPLNQQNHKQFLQLNDDEKKLYLDKMLVNNVLSFYKGLGYRTATKLMAYTTLKEKTTQFKNQTMLAFEGTFVTNAYLPDYIGLGKAVSRGFGTIYASK